MVKIFAYVASMQINKQDVISFSALKKGSIDVFEISSYTAERHSNW